MIVLRALLFVLVVGAMLVVGALVLTLAAAALAEFADVIPEPDGWTPYLHD